MLNWILENELLWLIFIMLLIYLMWIEPLFSPAEIFYDF